MASTTPVTTKSGADPFAGAGAPAVTGAPASTTPGPTDASVSSGGTSFQDFVNSGAATVGGTGKTFGGVPTSQFPTSIDLGQAFPTPGGQHTAGGVIPAYHDGDQWTPLHDPNPDNTRQIQIQMIEAGLLTASKVHLGIWDAYSASAYAKVLAAANTMPNAQGGIGVDAKTALDNFVHSSASLAKAQINPDDLNAMAQQIAENTLGRKLDPDQLAQFTTAFQTAIARSPGGGPQTSAGMGDLGGRVLAQEHPQEAHAESLHSVSRRALAVLTSPSVSLPGVQT